MFKIEVISFESIQEKIPEVIHRQNVNKMLQGLKYFLKNQSKVRIFFAFCEWFYRIWEANFVNFANF